MDGWGVGVGGWGCPIVPNTSLKTTSPKRRGCAAVGPGLAERWTCDHSLLKA